MNDPEFVELINRFFKGIVIVILFIVPLTIFIVKKFNVTESKVIKSIDEKENIVLFVTNGSCTTCKEIEQILDNINVKYTSINMDSDRNFKTILKKLDITTTDIDVPTIIYVEKGEVNSILVSIKTEEEITTFVENYNLTN